jgi:hypothetical protein
VVIEATGVPETINDALALSRRNGVAVVSGIHARPLALDLTTLVRKQHWMRGSFRPPESDCATPTGVEGDWLVCLAFDEKSVAAFARPGAALYARVPVG